MELAHLYVWSNKENEEATSKSVSRSLSLPLSLPPSPSRSPVPPLLLNLPPSLPLFRCPPPPDPITTHASAFLSSSLSLSIIPSYRRQPPPRLELAAAQVRRDEDARPEQLVRLVPRQGRGGVVAAEPRVSGVSVRPRRRP